MMAVAALIALAGVNSGGKRRCPGVYIGVYLF